MVCSQYKQCCKRSVKALCVRAGGGVKAEVNSENNLSFIADQNYKTQNDTGTEHTGRTDGEQTLTT